MSRSRAESAYQSVGHIVDILKMDLMEGEKKAKGWKISKNGMNVNI